MQAMVLSVIGRDKPGLIEQISRCVQSANGNWLRSRFCHLSGHFAGFVEVSLPSEQQDSLVKACEAIANLKITLVPAATNDSELVRSLEMVVTGNDRKGIVSDISQKLSQMDISIEEMDTSCESAPNWGNLIFTAKMTLACRRNTDIDDVKEALENITDDLVVEFI